MLELFRLLDRVTDTALPVVIYGESGTGKELVARAIHAHGPRRAGAFVADQLRRHPRDAARERALRPRARRLHRRRRRAQRPLRERRRRHAFLDEVGELPPRDAGQAPARPARGRVAPRRRRTRPSRSTCASSPPPTATSAAMVEERHVPRGPLLSPQRRPRALPPLRERRDDIPLLVEHFLRKLRRTERSARRAHRPAALHKLVGYPWPGNVRELENEIERAASLGGTSSPSRISRRRLPPGPGPRSSHPTISLKHRVERLERTLLREALHRAAGNQTQAARLLGLSRFGLQKKLRRYEID